MGILSRRVPLKRVESPERVNSVPSKSNLDQISNEVYENSHMLIGEQSEIMPNPDKYDQYVINS